MNDGGRSIIGVLVALLVGLAGGYGLGFWQKMQCDERLDAARRAAQQTTRAMDEQMSRIADIEAAHRRAQAASDANVELLRAMVQVAAKNFGLASQHLGAAKTKVEKALTPDNRDEYARAFLQRTEKVRAKAMLLDPAVQQQIEELIKQLPSLWKDRSTK